MSSHSTTPARNRLGGETSPYLRQHAHNPVDWYPWGPEALERARRENKPILLSIGYSACHWCHVMAHESFEDDATAALMNRLFVNIKVDREERPDLDKIYQLAHQLLNRRGGGWPLTMFLLPENQSPFFAGTYFPVTERYGMPAFADLLQRIAGFYDEHRSELDRQSESLQRALQQLTRQERDGGVLTAALLEAARQQLADSYDAVHGGFGPAPKFPHPTQLARLLRHSHQSQAAGTADDQALSMALHTLRSMAQGGLFDQLGGGFARYSVDERWLIPHFEKMLYDNGPLLALYAEAWQISREDYFREVAEQTAGWVMREMQSPEGGYYSALDADSEGEEGKFYVWSREEVRGLLSADEYAMLASHFGLDQDANFEGHWHLHIARDVATVAASLGIETTEAQRRLNSAREKLFAARAGRIRPGRDDKILTAWNGLTIKGMATAGRILDRTDWLDSATRAVDFIRDQLWRDGRLLATYKDGKARLTAYLDDYVFLADGLLELLQARWRSADLRFAIELMDVGLAHFQDDERGGFYFTADDHETLLQRPKPLSDEATPAGNGVAASVLLRLGHLLGNAKYLQAASHTLQSAAASIHQVPYAHCSLLEALALEIAPPEIIVLRGEENELEEWRRLAQHNFAPQRLVFAIPRDSDNLPGLLAERRPRDQGMVAYRCTGHTCRAPITRREELQQTLTET